LRRLRKTLLIGAAAAMAVTALGAPAAASHGKGTVGIVNGFPGQKVDICINGKEIRSRVPYGGRAFRTMTPGSKLIKIFKADPRKCRSRKVAQKRIGLVEDADLSYVIGKQAPKFTRFDNMFLGAIPPNGPDTHFGYVAYRHAASLGSVNFHFAVVTDSPIGPAANPIWQRGDQSAGDVTPGTTYRIRATRPEATSTLAKSRIIEIKHGHRYEWYLLGTKAKNAKFIVWDRRVSQPIP
jgi:hypothetical protein